MRRGEVWWVDFDERRPVVLLSEEAKGFRVMQVVAPAGVDIGGLGVEVAIGAPDGLPFEGVLRFGFPRPGYTPCTWLTTMSGDDLIERAGVLSSARLSEVEDALRRSEEQREWTPATAARFGHIKDALGLSGWTSSSDGCRTGFSSGSPEEGTDSAARVSSSAGHR